MEILAHSVRAPPGRQPRWARQTSTIWNPRMKCVKSIQNVPRAPGRPGDRRVVVSEQGGGLTRPGRISPDHQDHRLVVVSVEDPQPIPKPPELASQSLV